MTPTERAAEIGREHGTRDAETWWTEEGSGLPSTTMTLLFDGGASSFAWPEPDLIENVERFAELFGEGESDEDVILTWESAYRAAVEETIRAKCEEGTR